MWTFSTIYINFWPEKPLNRLLSPLTYLSLTAADVLAVGGEGGDEVGAGEQTVLVGVHDAEGLLELLDGRVGEGVEDVGFLRHGGGDGAETAETKGV